MKLNHGILRIRSEFEGGTDWAVAICAGGVAGAALLTPSLGTTLALSTAVSGLLLVARRARRRAGRLEDLRQTLDQAIIHDLKNPMTSVIACLAVLRDPELDLADREKLTLLALDACHAQMTLLETLVDTTRIEFGEMALDVEPLRVAAVVARALDEIRPPAVEVGLEVRDTSQDAGDLIVNADRGLLRRVLANLLHNSVKYSRDGGLIALGARRDGAHALITVRDRGIGIPQHLIGRLFDKYFRVEGPDQTSRRGSGLGLYFCRLVIEAHGGSIAVSSTGDRGTEIQIRLPAEPRSPAHEPSVRLQTVPDHR